MIAPVKGSTTGRIHRRQVHVEDHGQDSQLSSLPRLRRQFGQPPSTLSTCQPDQVIAPWTLRACALFKSLDPTGELPERHKVIRQPGSFNFICQSITPESDIIHLPNWSHFREAFGLRET